MLPNISLFKNGLLFGVPVINGTVAVTSIGSIRLSDHSPIYLHMFAFHRTVRSPTSRLNSSLLLDETFKDLQVTNQFIHKPMFCLFPLLEGGGTGHLVSDPHKINAVFSDYYKNLFSIESLVLQVSKYFC